MQDKLLSVIMPVYNIEKYLNRSVDSILAQTYENFELILIDDGSKDNSGSICDEYTQKDNRVKVIHKENGGAASARNIGLDNAKGELIGFVDSDDYIVPQMYENLVKLLTDTNTDIACCEIYTELGQNKIYGDVKVYSNEDALQMVLEEKILSFPVTKVYKKEVFENVRFPEGMTFEDLCVMPYVFNNAKNGVSYTKDEYYYYYATRVGNVSSNVTVKHTKSCAVAFIDRFNFAIKNEIKKRDIILEKAVRMSMGAYKRCIKSGEFNDFICDVKAFYRRNMKEILKDKRIGLAYRMMAVIIGYTPIYDFVMKGR